VDLLPPDEKLEWLKSISHPSDGSDPPVMVSAVTGEGLDELLRRIDKALPSDPMVKLSLRVPLTEGRTLALVHALGHVLHSEVNDSYMLVEAEVPVSMAGRLKLQEYAARGTF
jgi:GTP-binding protein HflX